MKYVLFLFSGIMFGALAVRINNDANTITNLSYRVYQLENSGQCGPASVIHHK